MTCIESISTAEPTEEEFDEADKLFRQGLARSVVYHEEFKYGHNELYATTMKPIYKCPNYYVYKYVLFYEDGKWFVEAKRDAFEAVFGTVWHRAPLDPPVSRTYTIEEWSGGVEFFTLT